MSLRIGEAQAALERALREGIREAAEYVMAESDKRVPTEEGDLDKSSAVTAAGNRATVAYDTPYAVIQHENMRLRHDHGRSAKFLENAANGNRDRILDVVADEIRKVVR